VLLSPVIAFLLAIASDAVICEMVGTGAPAGAALAAVAGLLFLWRLRAHRVAPGKRGTRPNFECFLNEATEKT
jgi:hypothetical protein